jgi:hypothetical protein
MDYVQHGKCLTVQGISVTITSYYQVITITSWRNILIVDKIEVVE